MLNTVITLAMLVHISKSVCPSSTQFIGTILNASSQNNLSAITYDEGHLTLQKIIDKLDQYSANLDRGSYIGYQFSIGQLYHYLLAINYKAEELLDPKYKYNYRFSSFEELVTAYHENVDFSSVQLTKMKHTGSTIEIDIRYKHKKTNRVSSLNYVLDYGVHGLTDLSDFSRSTTLPN